MRSARDKRDGKDAKGHDSGYFKVTFFEDENEDEEEFLEHFSLFPLIPGYSGLLYRPPELRVCGPSFAAGATRMGRFSVADATEGR